MKVAEFEHIGYIQGMNYVAAVLIFHAADGPCISVIRYC